MPKIPGKFQGSKVPDLREIHLAPELRAWYTSRGLWDKIIGCRSTIHPKLKRPAVSVKLTQGRSHYWLVSQEGSWDLNRTTDLPGPYNLVTPEGARSIECQK